ncbi:MAG TPA: metallophosphoesterase [Longimicrobiaceae bacterium]|nr:metallophosphoesterase [Longimicrobiaceae bacterium]
MTDDIEQTAPEQLQSRPRRERRKGDRRRDDAPRSVRIAAVGDFHCGEEDSGAYRPLFARVNEEADVLLLAGDLTRWGTAAEMRVAVGELSDVEIPVVAVLGNHDYEAGQTEEISVILREAGIHLLDGDAYELTPDVGIAGVKGFMGGFGRGTLTAFGEPEIKQFVSASLDEVQKLELALRRLGTPVRIALLHYAPVAETVAGEPEKIHPFLGTDRLAEPLDRYRAAVAFHGHAHLGTFRGATVGGVPVFNVSHALLRKDGIGEMYYLHEIDIPAANHSQSETA